MGKAMEKGMTLVMSLWDDHAQNMLWLDSSYPKGKTGPGVARGSCAATSGVPANVESQHPNAKVTFSNIKIGEIGSTYKGGKPGPTPPGPSGCPGGSLKSCMDLCPATPASAFEACVKECVKRCNGEDKEESFANDFFQQ